MKKFLSGFEDGFCALVLGIMTILTFVNVIARYILKSSMPFVEELTRLGLVILSLMGAALAAKRAAHLGLSVLTDMLPKSKQKWVNFLANICGIIFSALIMYFGFFMAKNEYDLGQLTAGMQWPEWMFGMFVPISGAILLIRYIQLAIKCLTDKEEEESVQ